MLLYNTIVTEDKNFEKSTNEKKTEKKTDMDGGRTGRSFCIWDWPFISTITFFPKTTLNGRKAGGYTAQKVMDQITEEIHSYQC